MANFLRRLYRLYVNAFSGLPPKVWLLSLVLLINRSGAMVVAFLSVYLVNEQGYSLSRSGWVMAAFGAGGILGNYLGGLLNDRYGSWHIMFYSLIGAGGLNILLGQVDDFYLICLVAFLISTVADAFRPANRAAVAIYAPAEVLTQSYGLQRLAINLGFSIGPALGGWLIYAYGYELLFWGDGFTYWVAALVFYWVLPADETARPLVTGSSGTQLPRAAAPPAHRQPWLLLMALANVAIILCFFQFFSTIPLYLKDIGYSEKLIGLSITLSGLTIVLLEMPLVYLAERRYRAIPVMLVGGAIMVGSYAVLPLLAVAFAGLGLFMVVLTIGEIFYMPFTSTYVARWSPPARRGEYLGVLSASYSAAFVATPLICLNVAEYYGYLSSIYVACALGGAGILLLAGVERLRVRDVAEEAPSPAA